MIKNKFGEKVYSEDDLMALLMVDPGSSISNATTECSLSEKLSEMLDRVPVLRQPADPALTVEDYDAHNQAQWAMPDEYRHLDIAEYILSLCKTEAELQRVGEELLLYQERNLFDLLRYLKYLVDTMNRHNILYGVGRGSSVASYVLYLLGVHRINSMYYNLDPKDFLR